MQQIAAKTSRLAVWSLVLGILSLGLTVFTGVPAVICGHLALSKIRRAAGTIGGEGLATAGLITGYIGSILGAITLAIVAAVALPAFLHFEREFKVAQHQRVKADVQTFSIQLEMYKALNGAYPTTEQGLQALVTEPVTDPKPERWSQLLQTIPKDPWGNDYIYISPGQKHPDRFDLYSRGPDKIPNTSDDDWGD